MEGERISHCCVLFCCIILFNIYQCGQISGNAEVSMTQNLGEMCDIRDLLGRHKGASLTCSSLINDYLVDDLTVCWVNNKDTSLELQCEEGLWTHTTGTDLHKRQKRLVLIGLGVLIYCLASEKCWGGNESPRNKPPVYSSCPASGKMYAAERKKTSYKVTWTKPTLTANDDEKGVKETVSLEIGDDFPGYPAPYGKEYTVIYKAKDKDGLQDTCFFSFSVQYYSCPARTTIQNGEVKHCSHKNIYGSECTFGCNNGYKMNGSAKTTCMKSEEWDNSPKCQKVRCPKPFQLMNGSVACADKKYQFESHCSFQCDNGFKIDGPRQMSCQINQNWSVMQSEVSCKDDEAPVITCSPPKIFYADRNSFIATVNWDEPTATDNTDLNPDIVKLSGPTQGDNLEEGSYYVTYNASDSDGNYDPRLSKCNVSLDVKVIRCPTGPFDALSNSRFMMYNCTDTSFYNGVSCNLACDLNLPLNGSDIMSCERDGTSGNGVWIWQSSEPFCNVVQCPPLDPPANGAFTTDSVNARPLHVMLCQKGYDIPSVGSAFQGRLSCQDSGKWYPLQAFPDCIVAVLSLLKLPAELYYEGNCNSNATAEQIKTQVLEYLNGVKADIDNSICPDNNTCKIENLNVFCGESTGRRRRTATNQRRLFKRQNDFALVTWNIVTVFDKGNQTVEEAFNHVLTVFKDLETRIESDITNGKLDVTGFTLASDAFQMDSKPTFACESGYKLDAGSVSCKPCPSGTYLNSTTIECDYCDIGSYTEHEGASVCTSCQAKHSTLSEGSKTKTDCKKLCSPGYFSSTTMEPCFPCSVGTFQPIYGRNNCELCPLGTTTKETNNSAANSCESFDIFFGQTNNTTVIGTFTADSVTTLSISFWLRLTEIERKKLSINIVDISGYMINLTSMDYISVRFGDSNEAITNSSFSAEYWTHTICILNVSTNAIKVFVAGALVADIDGTSTDMSRHLSQLTVELDNISKGIFISGLVIYNRPIRDTEVSFLSQTCSVKQNDEVFSMTNVLQKNLEGSVTVSPTACDPIDECKTGPCGYHKCINTVAGFNCICHGGMTGELCDVPPDYCLDNGCKHGDCIPANRTYFCNCSDGYSGLFCTEPPVNGGWSEWEQWSQCTLSCGNGTRERPRICNNPAPGYMGLNCEGEKLQVESCNQQICPTCPNLERRYGTKVTCKDNSKDNLIECKMLCIRGKILPNGQKPFERYWCGVSTDYQWLPTFKLPECVDFTVPGAFGTQASISYMDSIPNSEKESVRMSIEDRLSTVGCIKNQTCQLTSTFPPQDKNKRSTTTKLLLKFSINLTDKDSLTDGDYLLNGTEPAAVTEYLNAQNTANEILKFIHENSTAIFDVSVGDKDYTSDSSSLSLAATVTCKEGYAGAEGYCAQCAAGTKLTFPDCSDCDVGTYQPFSGQTNCLLCPKGYTTPTAGASNISECSVMLGTTASTTVSTDKPDVEVNTEETTNIDDDNTVLIVVVVVSAVAAVCAVIVIVVCLIRKYHKGLLWLNRSNDSKRCDYPEVFPLSTAKQE